MILDLISFTLSLFLIYLIYTYCHLIFFILVNNKENIRRQPLRKTCTRWTLFLDYTDKKKELERHNRTGPGLYFIVFSIVRTWPPGLYFVISLCFPMYIRWFCVCPGRDNIYVTPNNFKSQPLKLRSMKYII
jgi:hypothetical protein